MKNTFIFLAFGSILLAAALGYRNDSWSCEEQPYQYNDCSDQERTDVYYFSTEHNKCLVYAACPSDVDDSENLFDSSEECEVECPATECAPPNRVTNGQYSVEGNVVQYTCNHGYELDGEAVQYCQYDGSWSGSPPACVSSGVTCPLEDDAHHSRHMVLQMCPGSQTPGCRILYSCKKGYSKVMGEFGIVCLPDGTWSADPPLCGRLAILHGQKEVSENVEIKDGDSNVQISCTMEPAFPPTAPVMWYPHGNTSWSGDHSAYILTFNQLHYKDAGDYTCSLQYDDNSLTSKIKIIVVPKSYVQIRPYMPPWVLKLYHKIDITCIFEGIPKPNISWHYEHQQLSNSVGHIAITEHSQNSNTFAVSRLEILNPTQDDEGLYECIASNQFDTVTAPVNIDDIAPFRGKKRSVISANTPLCKQQDTVVVFVGRVGRRLSDDRYHVSVSEQLTFNVQLEDVIEVDGFSNDPPVQRRPKIFFVQLQDNGGYTLISYKRFEEKLSQLLCN